jgi:hypothetical protein
MPVTSSETGCSTWSRQFTSMKKRRQIHELERPGSDGRRGMRIHPLLPLAGPDRHGRATPRSASDASLDRHSRSPAWHLASCVTRTWISPRAERASAFSTYSSRRQSGSASRLQACADSSRLGATIAFLAAPPAEAFQKHQERCVVPPPKGKIRGSIGAGNAHQPRSHSQRHLVPHHYDVGPGAREPRSEPSHARTNSSF